MDSAKTVTRPLFVPYPYQDSPMRGRVLLRDGSSATIKLAKSADQTALTAFFDRLSQETLRQRFFTVSAPSETQIEEFCDSENPEQRFTLLVYRGMEGEPEVIAAATYAVEKENSAEFAVAVADEYQGEGLGSVLLERLATVAAQHGITHFSALTQDQNRAMLEVFRRSGFKIREDHSAGYATVDLSLIPSRDSVQISAMRDRVFTVASMRPFFKPKSVAVIGTSRRPSNVGHRILKELYSSGFLSSIYAVNPSTPQVFVKDVGVLNCLPSITAIPTNIDLAVICVPPRLALPAIDECATKGVRALVVISAGFAETGDAGQSLQQEMLEKARGYGMRIVGPNCLGILNTDPEVRLNASFSPIYPEHGNIAMFSQSGALGLAVLGLARRMKLGLSSFVSIGNKVDVSGNDLLLYWEDDPQTAVILMYIEALKNPLRFARIARRVSRRKPLLCVKGGISSAGQRAAGSHTAALAGSDVPVDALFRQSGVIRCENLDEMFHIAAALSCQPLPEGPRVGVVTNAGGPGILCADGCEAAELSVPELSEETQRTLRANLPAAASTLNPVDTLAAATPDQFRRTVATMLLTEEVDALAVIYIPVGVADDTEVLDGIRRGVTDARSQGITNKPVLLCPMFGESDCPPLQCGDETLPTYAFPETVALVLGQMHRYHAWTQRPLSRFVDFIDANTRKVRAICRKAVRDRGAGWMTAEEIEALMGHMNLPYAAAKLARTADEAVAAADGFGYPVAVKLSSHTLVHKTEVGGVVLGLESADAVRQAFNDIRGRLEERQQADAMDGVLVQPMLEQGVEIMIGVSEDPTFGPLIAFGLGGIYVEILRDVTFRITPLSERDADLMLHEIRGRRLLEGYRGHPAADEEALKELLLRISLLVEEVPEIVELDLNPVFALPPGQGCRIADARIRLEPMGKRPKPSRYSVAGHAE